MRFERDSRPFVQHTVSVARLASTIYRRAILRTGGRVRFREAFARTSAH